jgi:hypothetical protein
MPLDDGPFPCGRTKIFILIGESYIVRKVFTDKDVAMKDLEACASNHSYVLEYVACVRQYGKMRLINRYYICKDTRMQRCEPLCLEEDNDRHIINTICPEAIDVFRFDEYGDVCGVDLKHPGAESLRANLHLFPKWLMVNVKRYVGFDSDE